MLFICEGEYHLTQIQELVRRSYLMSREKISIMLFAARVNHNDITESQSQQHCICYIKYTFLRNKYFLAEQDKILSSSARSWLNENLGS